MTETACQRKRVLTELGKNKIYSNILPTGLAATNFNMLILATESHFPYKNVGNLPF